MKRAIIKVVVIFGIYLLSTSASGAKEFPIDVPAEVIPAGLAQSDLDSWIAMNLNSFDFYVEGRALADYRKSAERKVLQARKDAQERVARIDSRLKEQLTGDASKDQELQKASEKKKQKVYNEELAMEESVMNRQMRREVDIMKQKRFSETKIADVQREYREQLVALRKSGASRITAAAAGLPELDPELGKESGGNTKITIDKQQRLNVETKPYGGDMSDRAKRRIDSR